MQERSLYRPCERPSLHRRRSLRAHGTVDAGESAHPLAAEGAPHRFAHLFLPGQRVRGLVSRQRPRRRVSRTGSQPGDFSQGARGHAGPGQGQRRAAGYRLRTGPRLDDQRQPRRAILQNGDGLRAALSRGRRRSPPSFHHVKKLRIRVEVVDRILPEPWVEGAADAPRVANAAAGDVDDGKTYRVVHDAALRLVIQGGSPVPVAGAAPLLQQVVNAAVVGEVGSLVAGGRVRRLARMKEQAEHHVTVGEAGAAVKHERVQVVADVAVVRRVLHQL